MLAYASGRPRIAERRSSPNAMLIVISAHVALVAIVMSVKMDVAPRLIRPPIDIELIPDRKPPPPHPIPQPVRPPIQQPRFTQPVPMPRPVVEPQPVTAIPTFPDSDLSLPKPNPSPAGRPNPPPTAAAATGAQLLTPQSEIRPPYPESKLLSGEEATLRLRLAIDPNGRVIAVDSIGPADRAFLDAARRHIIAHWRYKPATQDGRAVATSVVITLEFRLNG